MLIDIALYYVGGRGGVETVVTSIYKELSNKGHKVRVLMAYPPPHAEWLESLGDVYYYGEEIGFDTGSYYMYGSKYKELMRKIGKPDICIAAHIPGQSYICYVGLGENTNDIPIISWLHGDIHIYASPELITYSNAHLAISRLVKSGIEEFDSKKVYLVNNPVDNINCKTIERPKEDILKILSIGRIEKEKNIVMLLNSLYKIQKKWKAIIIGDGSLKDILQGISEILGISNNIEWLGWQDNPWSVIDEASVLISTSNTEGFSMVLVEALARGIPVISTRCGGPLDIVEDGVNGWLVDINDDFQVANILNKINTNEIVLPQPEICKKSIEKYNSKKVASEIEKALLEQVRKFKA